MWERKKNIFSEHFAQVPVVDDMLESRWRIYYSNRIDGMSRPMYIDVDPRNSFSQLSEPIGPIFDLGRPGTFDNSGIMPTEIIQVGDLKYLYYIGWTRRVDVPYHNNLGLAISSDGGDTYRKYSDGPVFSTSHAEPGYVGTISILIENDVFRGWYLSCRNWKMIDGRMEPYYDIKHATSVDGITWTPDGITCIELNEGEGGISQASVRKIGQGFEMWFSYRMETDFRENPENAYHIGHAYSDDGFSWIRMPWPVLSPTGSLEDWDGIMTAYPYVVQSDSERFMFYNGNGFGSSGIGYARQLSDTR